MCLRPQRPSYEDLTQGRLSGDVPDGKTAAILQLSLNYILQLMCVIKSCQPSHPSFLFPSRGCEHIAVPEGSSVDNLCSPHMSERRAVQGSELARSAKQVYDGKTRAVKGEFSYVELLSASKGVWIHYQACLFDESRPPIVLNVYATETRLPCLGASE
ncbi:hypothetical protein ROHU_026210 [Labeo rohita]|uniref:Uncharacterized protein n=1 Tax=Labeo rohita TaxID=84645 RepID=A0A498MG66_LABRO|nr:hypothetical protein ROHU_026210 [Labeo rohita]